MKKLVLMLAVVFSASLFSCGGAKTADAEAQDTAAVVETVVEEVAVVADSAAAPADSAAAPVDSAAVAK